MSVRAKLGTHLPVIDPVHYIERFAAKMTLGAKTQAVCNTALRVVKRLSRDWLMTGRRPSGITGVALYIAAQLHGLQPNMSDLVQEMHVCDTTLRKRLSEFLESPSSNLKRQPFVDERAAIEVHSDDSEDEALPPALKARLDFENAAKKEEAGSSDDADADGDADADAGAANKKQSRGDRKRKAGEADASAATSSTAVASATKKSKSSDADASTADSRSAATSSKTTRALLRSSALLANDDEERGDKANADADDDEEEEDDDDDDGQPATVDSTTRGQIRRLALADIKRELKRRNLPVPTSAKDLRNALFRDNVDRESLLTSLTVGELRALARNDVNLAVPLDLPMPDDESERDDDQSARTDRADDALQSLVRASTSAAASSTAANAASHASASSAAAAAAKAAAEKKSAATLSLAERRSLLDRAQEALRQTITRDLETAHRERRERRRIDEEHKREMVEAERLREKHSKRMMLSAPKIVRDRASQSSALLMMPSEEASLARQRRALNDGFKVILLFDFFSFCYIFLFCFLF